MEDKQFESALWGTSWDEALLEKDAEQGSVSFSSEEGIRLAIPFGELLPSDMFGETKGADFLYGFSRNGEYLVLANARSIGSSESFPGGKKQIINADYVMSSRSKFDPSKKLQSITLKLKGVKEWLGEAPITATRYSNEKKIDVCMDIENASSIVLCENDPEISIEHSVVTTALTTKGINMMHDCYLSVKLANPCSIDEVHHKVLYPVQKFFSFCIGKQASVAEMKLHPVDSGNTIEYRGRFASSKKDISETDNIPLPYCKIKDQLEKLFYQWTTFEDDLERGASLLVSLLTIEWDMPLDLKFLASAQMLEALARHNQETKELDEEIFSRYIKAVEDSIKDVAARDWVLGKLKHSNHVSQRKLLKNFLNNLGAFSQYLIPDKNRFLENHLRLRNAYTHRSEECESPKLLKNSDLYWHMQGVLFLSYGTVLTYLGYTPEEVIEVFIKSHYEWYKISKIRKLYQKKSLTS